MIHKPSEQLGSNTQQAQGSERPFRESGLYLVRNSQSDCSTILTETGSMASRTPFFCRRPAILVTATILSPKYR